MSSSSMSKGPILRRFARGETGPAVRVLTTRTDWETRMIQDPTNPSFSVPMVGLSLVAFEAESYQEVSAGSDLWDFHVNEGGRKTHYFLAGEDIFLLCMPFQIDV